MGLFGGHKTQMVTPEAALAGRPQPMMVPERHLVLGSPLAPPFPEGFERGVFAMGCYWGAERMYWQADGVYSTAVGYTGGYTPHPTYREVCSGKTGHTEAVLVVFDPQKTSYEELLGLFFESHDPTQGMRQGNDVGTQYRSGLYTANEAQMTAAVGALERYQAALRAGRYGPITTEIAPAGPFYYAEDYHQQYLAANPWGYCGLGGTGVPCPAGVTGLGA